MTDLKKPQPRAGILDIAAYVPGDSASAGKRVFKLSANETPLGPSPAAIAAFRQAGDHLQDYPDGDATVLRQAIADIHGLAVDRIVCGAGSDELLALLAQAYLTAGDEAIYSAHGFMMYRIDILAAGATPVIAPETDETVDVDAILACVTAKTRMVFVANPNNPTGTYLPFSEVKRLQAGLPDHVILVLDAAYAEYVRRNDYESGIELAGAADNVIMTRTFSKIHGLASQRLGWAYGPAAIIDVLNRVRGPFNVTASAIAAGAAAVADRDHVDRSVAYNADWIVRLSEGLSQIGLRVTPSVGNFLLIHFPDRDGQRAADADRYLRENGFVLRQMGGYGFPNALRMSVGVDEANRGVLDALAKFLEPS
ncbi:MAG: pyridoxal phosphate-dependent aminotransferase [Alphaproteobacteria bacterium]